MKLAVDWGVKRIRHDACRLESNRTALVRGLHGVLAYTRTCTANVGVVPRRLLPVGDPPRAEQEARRANTCNLSFEGW